MPQSKADIAFAQARATMQAAGVEANVIDDVLSALLTAFVDAQAFAGLRYGGVTRAREIARIPFGGAKACAELRWRKRRA